jgi:mannitol/fructose-specific phosphotransferase system IIA component (Ntr-type)
VLLLQGNTEDGEAKVLVGTSQQGLVRDGTTTPVHLLFVVLRPLRDDEQVHLNRLGNIARVGATPGLVDRIKAARNPDDVLAALRPPARTGNTIPPPIGQPDDTRPAA